jgi:hypothetical protein
MDQSRDEPLLRIELEADHDAPFTAMFEPSGMTYNLAASERMYAEIRNPESRDIKIIHWRGGVSVWAPGALVTRNRDGDVLHSLA